MESITISRFNATCLSILERVHNTGQPILVTKRGAPIAQVLPPPRLEPLKESAFGCMRGTSEQLGDIITPFAEEGWEVLR